MAHELHQSVGDLIADRGIIGAGTMGGRVHVFLPTGPLVGGEGAGQLEDTGYGFDYKWTRWKTLCIYRGRNVSLLEYLGRYSDNLARDFYGFRSYAPNRFVVHGRMCRYCHRKLEDYKVNEYVGESEHARDGEVDRAQWLTT
jgi:hypothetical protein